MLCDLDANVVLPNSTVSKDLVSLFHYRNDLAVCIFQVVGRPLTGSFDICRSLL